MKIEMRFGLGDNFRILPLKLYEEAQSASCERLRIGELSPHTPELGFQVYRLSRCHIFDGRSSAL